MMFRTKSGKPVTGANGTLLRLSASVLDNVGKALDAGADVVLQEVRVTLNRPGLSRLNSRVHRVRPGEPPHRVSGALRDSARVEVAAENIRRIIGGGESAPYAAAQEFGTKSSPPHPFLRPAVVAAKERVIERMKQVLKEEKP